MQVMGGSISLLPGKRVLFLTKDFELIRKQLRGELDLTLDDVQPADLLDDINTDVMTPAWVCFDYKPEELAKNAYAGLVEQGERVVQRAGALRRRRSRSSSPASARAWARRAKRRCRRRSGAGSASPSPPASLPSTPANNINQGVLMGDYDILRRLQAGEDGSAR